MGTMQLNMMIHNTLFVVGHFHSTVVSGTTMAFMGISYYLVPLLSQIGVDIYGAAPYPGIMLLVSIGAIFAVTGGIMFVWVMVMTLLRGEKTERPDEGLLYAFGTPNASEWPRWRRWPRDRPGDGRHRANGAVRPPRQPLAQLRGTRDLRDRADLPALVHRVLRALAPRSGAALAGRLR
jgi:heme/copper-type cytochrome/quinol oxidase subunit 1